jgi:hypothetical protein
MAVRRVRRQWRVAVAEAVVCSHGTKQAYGCKEGAQATAHDPFGAPTHSVSESLPYKRPGLLCLKIKYELELETAYKIHCAYFDALASRFKKSRM